MRSLVKETTELQVARIAFVEAHSGLARAQLGGRLSPADADDARSRFTRLWSAAAVIELDVVLAERAATLTTRHALPAYDAVQLASALEARGDQPLAFACFDDELAHAARREGLDVRCQMS